MEPDSLPAAGARPQPFWRTPAHQKALDRVTAWTRARFALGDNAPVFVTEIACGVPGCPPRETVIAFWTEGNTRHHLKIFKPVTEVVEADLPPSWMKSALIAMDMVGCERC